LLAIGAVAVSGRDFERDPEVDAAFRALRSAHRAYRQSGHAGRSANVAAKRAQTVLEAQEIVWDRASALTAYVGPRPSRRSWRAARGQLANELVKGSPLLSDLRRAHYTDAPAISAQQVQDAIVAASLKYQRVIDETKALRADSGDPSSGTRSRSQKAAARRHARQEFEAVLAGLDLAITGVLNGDSPDLRTVAAGALTEG
jgi:hypothetical protein